MAETAADEVKVEALAGVRGEEGQKRWQKFKEDGVSYADCPNALVLLLDCRSGKTKFKGLLVLFSRGNRESSLNLSNRHPKHEKVMKTVHLPTPQLVNAYAPAASRN